MAGIVGTGAEHTIEFGRKLADFVNRIPFPGPNKLGVYRAFLGGGTVWGAGRQKSRHFFLPLLVFFRNN
jgi:hypothetical protein